MSIESTLAERGNRYGDFTDHADLAQGIQFRMQKFCLKADNDVGFIEPWKDRLNNVQRQALTVISDKIARILSGDPNYADNWHDIQGYAKLVEDRLPRPVEVVKPDVAHCPHCGASELHQLTCPTQPVITVNLGTSLSPPIDPADVDISDNSHPRWKDAPDWANYLAQDGDGSWYWYEHPIYAHEDDDAWYEQKGFDGRIDDAGEDAERNPDWRNTRHARPTK